jgi:uncharacterized protein (TIGR02001 family)
MSVKSLSFVAAASLLSVAAIAQTAAPAPNYTLSYNVGVVTDYRFRGITQTNYKPALQAGVDFAHKSGFYLGAWGSNVNWVKDFNGASKGDFEVDLYGGFKGEITKGLGFDVGVITYQYPGNDSGAVGTPGAAPTTSNANTLEFYAALSYSVATLKYSRSYGDFLGFAGSGGSQYWDLSANFDLGNGFTLTPHIGRQTINNVAGSVADYSDYALSLTKDLGNGLTVTGALVGTDANQAFYTNTFNGASGFIGKNGAYLGVKYSF